MGQCSCSFPVGFLWLCFGKRPHAGTPQCHTDNIPPVSGERLCKRLSLVRLLPFEAREENLANAIHLPPKLIQTVFTGLHKSTFHNVCIRQTIWISQSSLFRDTRLCLRVHLQIHWRVLCRILYLKFLVSELPLKFSNTTYSTLFTREICSIPFHAFQKLLLYLPYTLANMSNQV